MNIQPRTTSHEPRTTNHGFTLLEVLLTVGISALILISTYSSLRGGWLTYNKLNTRTQSYHNIRNGLHNLSKDIRNSFIFNGSDNHAIGFKGTQSEMSFAALIKSKDEKGTNYIEPAKIYYKFENKKLLKARIKGKEILKTSSELKYTVFLSDLSELKFEYAKEVNPNSQGITWNANYEEKDALPSGVRLSLTKEFKDGKPFSLTQTIKLFQATAKEEK